MSGTSACDCRDAVTTITFLPVWEDGVMKKSPAAVVATQAPEEAAFAEVVGFIQTARGRSLLAVNTEVIDLYWRIGDYLHHKIEADGWAKGTVVQLAAYIARREPGRRGFSPQNLWRMRQFYEAYRQQEKLSSLLRVLAWTHHMIILGQSTARPISTKVCWPSCAPSWSSWVATSVSSVRNILSRWAAGTFHWTCSSSTAA